MSPENSDDEMDDLEDPLDLADSLSNNPPIPPGLQNAIAHPNTASGQLAMSEIAAQLLDIEQEAAQQAIDRHAEITANKGTEAAYSRQVKRYEEWWEQREF